MAFRLKGVKIAKADKISNLFVFRAEKKQFAITIKKRYIYLKVPTDIQ